MTTNVHPIALKPERSPAEQAAYEQGVADAKAAIENAHDANYNLIRMGNACLSWGYIVKLATAFIDAACLPPPEPEIEVTEAMAAAGKEAYLHADKGLVANETYEDIYRAMERQRRADEKQEAGE